MSVRWWTAVALFLLLAAGPAPGDIVTLTNGQEIFGVIAAEDDDTISLSVSGSLLTFPRSRITGIVRNTEAANMLYRGDELLVEGRFAEAIHHYKLGIEAEPELARQKITAARQWMTREVDRRLAVEGLDAVEREIRAKLAVRTLPQGEREEHEIRLAHVLYVRGRLFTDHMELEKAVETFRQAWKLSPETPGLAVAYGTALLDTRQHVEACRVLDEANRLDPDDMKVVQLYVDQFARSHPWICLRMLYPGGQAHHRLTASLRHVLPSMMLAAASSRPYPAEAPFDREDLLRRYLELEPTGDQAPLFEVRMEKNPAEPRIPFEMALYLIDRQRYKEAREVLDRVERLDPEFAGLADMSAELQRLIMQRAISDELREIMGLELIIDRVSRLEAADFPKSGEQAARLADEAKSIGLIPRLRPSRGSMTADEYFEALKAYRVRLESVVPRIAQLNHRSQVELEQESIERRARQREEKAMELAERDAQRQQATEYIVQKYFGNGSGRAYEVREYTLDGKLFYFARNIVVENGKLVSGQILYP